MKNGKQERTTLPKAKRQQRKFCHSVIRGSRHTSGQLVQALIGQLRADQQPLVSMSRQTIIVFTAFLCYHTALATDVKVSSRNVQEHKPAGAGKDLFTARERIVPLVRMGKLYSAARPNTSCQWHTIVTSPFFLALRRGAAMDERE
jgi:hypothetical protein